MATVKKWIVWSWMLLGVSGCHPSLSPLLVAADNQGWDSAVQYAIGDRFLESHLAAQIVEDAAQKSEFPKPFVTALPPALLAGKRSLKRLAAGPAEMPATQLAQIVLYRNSRRLPLQRKQYLQSDFGVVRELATTSWSASLTPEELILITRDTNPIVRGAAAAALCSRPNHPQTTALLKERLLHDPVPHVRAAAARCGAVYGEERSLIFRDAIVRDRNDGVARAAMEGLLQRATVSDIGWLIRFSSGPFTIRRLYGAAVLAHRGIPEGKIRLQHALQSDDETIVLAAISLLAFGNLDAPETVLTPLLQKSDTISAAAARALLAEGFATKEVITLLQNRWKNGIDAEACLLALARQEDSDAMSEIRTMLSSKTVSVSNIEAFQNVDALYPVFVRLLAHPKEEIRRQAAVAVLTLSKEREHVH